MIHLKVLTPDKVALEEDVDGVSAPTENGEITILSRHINLFSILVEGIVKIKKKKEEELFAIGGGFLETDGEEVNVLVSRAYGQDEIDQRLTERAIEDAKKIIKEAKDETQRYEAVAILRRSVIDMKLIKRRHHRPIS